MSKPAPRRRRPKPSQRDPFDRQKAQITARAAPSQDKSPKGSIDAPIVDLVNALNAHADYVTTSSCSGRIVLYASPGTGAAAGGLSTAKGTGRWLLSKHGKVTAAEVTGALGPAVLETLEEGSVVSFKHEAFVLHTQCRTVEAAQALLRLAHASGFRESGVSVGAKKIICAVRTTSNSLELPVVDGSRRLVPDEYLSYLADCANSKFDVNRRRTDMFFERLTRELLHPGARSPVDASPAGAAGKATATTDGVPASAASSSSTVSSSVSPSAPSPVKQRQQQSSQHQCQQCSAAFSSRNRLFRHLASAECKAGTQLGLEQKQQQHKEDSSAVDAMDGPGLDALAAESNVESLTRWSHTACASSSSSSSSSLLSDVLVFGGFGPQGSAKKSKSNGRKSDVVRISFDTGSTGNDSSGVAVTSALAVHLTPPGGADRGQGAGPGSGGERSFEPTPRVRHASARLDVGVGADSSSEESLMVVFGGRAGPARPYGDVAFLRLGCAAGHAPTWCEAVDGTPDGSSDGDRGNMVGSETAASGVARPAPRWSHTLTALSTHAGAASRGPDAGGDRCGDRCGDGGWSHALMYGGRDCDQVFSDVWLLSVQVLASAGAVAQRDAGSKSGDGAGGDYVASTRHTQPPLVVRYRWTEVAPAAPLGPAQIACFSHTATLIKRLRPLPSGDVQATVAMVGGCSQIASFDEHTLVRSNRDRMLTISLTGAGGASATPSWSCSAPTDTASAGGLRVFAHASVPVAPTSAADHSNCGGADPTHLLVIGGLGAPSNSARATAMQAQAAAGDMDPDDDVDLDAAPFQAHSMTLMDLSTGFSEAVDESLCRWLAVDGGKPRSAQQEVLVRHTATLIGPALVAVIGGGGICFSFGHHFSQARLLDTTGLLQRIEQQQPSSEESKVSQPTPRPTAPAAASGACNASALVLHQSLAKAARAALEVTAPPLYDDSRRIGRPTPADAFGKDMLAIPLTPAAVLHLSVDPQQVESKSQPLVASDSGDEHLEKQGLVVRDLLAQGVAVLGETSLPASKRATSRATHPAARVKAAVRALFLANASLPLSAVKGGSSEDASAIEELLESLPTKYERLGEDVVVIPTSCCRGSPWDGLTTPGGSPGSILWQTMADTLGVSRILRAGKEVRGNTWHERMSNEFVLLVLV